MSKEEVIDCLENNEFDLSWNEDKGIMLRAYLLRLVKENEEKRQ